VVFSPVAKVFASQGDAGIRELQTRFLR